MVISARQLSTGSANGGRIVRVRPDGGLEVVEDSQTDGWFVVPSGTTAQRPPSPANGTMRFNTDAGALEIWAGNTWTQFPGVGTGWRRFYRNADYDQTVLQDYVPWDAAEGPASAIIDLVPGDTTRVELKAKGLYLIAASVWGQTNDGAGWFQFNGRVMRDDSYSTNLFQFGLGNGPHPSGVAMNAAGHGCGFGWALRGVSSPPERYRLEIVAESLNIRLLGKTGNTYRTWLAVVLLRETA